MKTQIYELSLVECLRFLIFMYVCAFVVRCPNGRRDNSSHDNSYRAISSHFPHLRDVSYQRHFMTAHTATVPHSDISSSPSGDCAPIPWCLKAGVRKLINPPLNTI